MGNQKDNTGSKEISDNTHTYRHSRLGIIYKVKLVNNFTAIINCILLDKIHLHFHGMNHLYYYQFFLNLVIK